MRGVVGRGEQDEADAAIVDVWGGGRGWDVGEVEEGEVGGEGGG